MALKTHPDKGGKVEDFHFVFAAFEVLSDQSKRTLYDRDLRCRVCQDGVEVDATTIGVDVELGEGRSAEKRLRPCAHSVCLALLSKGREEGLLGVEDHLSKMSIDEFEHAKAYLVTSVRHSVGHRRIDADPSEFPREIATPKLLPLGWKGMQYLRQGGKRNGSPHTVFVSPWGTKLHSAWSCIRADAHRNGRDADEAVRLYREQKSKQNQQPIARTRESV